MEDINELCKLMQAKFGIDSSELRQAIKKHKADCENVKDIAEWTAVGGYDLAPGESVKVRGREIYTVTRSKKIPTSVYCSCPAWRYQRLNPMVRTCKHCKAVCGAESEEKRCDANK